MKKRIFFPTGPDIPDIPDTLPQQVGFDGSRRGTASQAPRRAGQRGKGAGRSPYGGAVRPSPRASSGKAQFVADGGNDYRIAARCFGVVPKKPASASLGFRNLRHGAALPFAKCQAWRITPPARWWQRMRQARQPFGGIRPGQVSPQLQEGGNGLPLGCGGIKGQGNTLRASSAFIALRVVPVGALAV